MAIHEAKLLWPKSEIQCVVSCGTGRSIPSSLTETSASAAGNLDSVSWKTLFDRILDSATDTEGKTIIMIIIQYRRINSGIYILKAYFFVRSCVIGGGYLEFRVGGSKL